MTVPQTTRSKWRRHSGTPHGSWPKQTAGRHRPSTVGFAEARSEWILYLDADDELYPEAIALVGGVMSVGQSCVLLVTGGRGSWGRGDA